jgi:hypothetical protein
MGFCFQNRVKKTLRKSVSCMDVIRSRTNDIFVKLQLGCHPVAVVQYTFTHKQYTERHKTNNTQNDTKQTIHRTQKFLEECGPCPVCASYTLAFALQLSKNFSLGSRRMPAGMMKIHKHKIRIYRHNTTDGTNLLIHVWV